MAEKNYDQPQHRANPKSQPPAKTDRDNAGIEQSDHGGGADGRANPEAGIDDQVNTAPDARGNQFVDCGVDGRIFAANARSGQRAKQRVRSEVPGERRKRRGAEIEQQSYGEQPLASEPVCGVAEEESACDRSNEIEGRAGPDLCVCEGKRIRALEHRANCAGERDLKAVKHPGNAQSDHHQPVPAAPGQAVKPRGHVTFNNRVSDGFCGHADRNAGRKPQDVRSGRLKQ
jgi:hypothetical protein